MRITFYGNHSQSYCSESHHAASLESLGHTVVRLQEPKVTAEQLVAEAEQSDLFCWTKTHGWDTPGMKGALRGIKAAGVPIVAYHLDLYLPLPERWKQYQEDPYMRSIDHFFTVDRLMSDWLNQNTSVRGHYLPAAVFGPECYLATPGERFDVAFVGSKGYHPEWPYRPQLIDWLHDTYGDRFRHYGGGGRPAVRGAELNQVYADARIVVGDSLCPNFDYPDYWSDRVYETLGRGGFLIHPYIKGMERTFIPGRHLEFYDYGDFDQLKTYIDDYLDADAYERELIRVNGHEHVKANHTYAHRWAEILEKVAP